MEWIRRQRRTQEGDWLLTALGVMWLAVFPLWQGGSYSSITRTKWIGMLILTGVTALGGVGYAARRLLRGKKLRWGWMQMAALAYFGLVALSAVFGAWADHTADSGLPTVLIGAFRYEGLVTQGCYAAIFLCMSLGRVRLAPLLHAASATLLLYGGIVALQYAEINVLGLFPMGMSVYTNYEFQGTLGNIDVVVGYLSIVMAAALGGFVRVKPCWLWLAAGLTGVLLTLLMEVQCGLMMLAGLLLLLLLAALRWPECRARALTVLAGTLGMLSVRLLVGLPWLDGTETLCLRFAWWRLLPAAAGAVMAALARLLRQRPGQAMRPRWVAAAAAAMAAVLLLGLYVLPLPEGSGLWEMQEVLYGRPRDSYGSERIGIWRLTLEMSRGNLLWGTGPDAFLHAMDHYQWETQQSLEQRFDNPHNHLLMVLSGSGLPAMGLYAALCLGGAAWGLCRGGREGFPLALAAACYMAQGMFTFSVCLVTPLFWAALGMLAGMMNQRRSAGGRAETERMKEQ